ncbi:MAG: hypothetical protein C4541_13580 [Candidatus Auribacter fodinae]|jgi:positive regulator of sigma E activity|uniref:SoxR reducing system RseC family protein n=1 Tax=Candidatus Auribacter fodinae TaxID=2093366 RepID=A0A3A4QTQ5_9BACT|nr:MAG: hypothetical protein C4541_13580 [Candidatus Auribacter fodinae]
MSVRECGTVIEITPEKTRVEIIPSATCDNCKCCSGLQSGRTISARSKAGIQKGDRVTVESTTADVLKAGLLLFFMPTLGIICGISAVHFIAERPADINYFFGAAAGVIVSFFILKAIAKKTLHMAEIIEKY